VAPARPAPARGRALRVLVVDDNVDAAEMLGELLRVFGHEPTVVHDASSALAHAEPAPDVAFLDIGLPDLDGYELARRLRALPGYAGAALVALTGYGQASDRASSRAAGFAEHLVKPVDIARLRAILDTVAAG
jgi:CheY-like chemotaxis protein